MIFYIHHKYDYQLFWYFFHGTEVKPENIPTWTFKNRHNKFKKINLEVEVPFIFNGEEHKAKFVGKHFWDKSDGLHIFDYHIDLMEKNVIGDRGWNRYMHDKLNDTISFLKKQKSNSKIIFFYQNWETKNLKEKQLLSTLPENVTLYIDSDSEEKFYRNTKYSSTHVLSSYVFPDTIKLKDYYRIAKYIKNYSNYKSKINYPIRSLTPAKKSLLEMISNLKNKDITCSISSFTEYKQHEVRNVPKKIQMYNDIISNNDIEIIRKRGYNLDDWGGEWNDSNMKEFMWKLLTKSQVNIIHEASYDDYVNEKSISHILAGKPFLPVCIFTIDYYNKLFAKYNLPQVELPIKYKFIHEVLDELNEITKDENKWSSFCEKLQNVVDILRDNYKKCIHNNNDMLSYFLSNEKIKESKSSLI